MPLRVRGGNRPVKRYVPSPSRYVNTDLRTLNYLSKPFYLSTTTFYILRSTRMFGSCSARSDCIALDMLSLAYQCIALPLYQSLMKPFLSLPFCLFFRGNCRKGGAERNALWADTINKLTCWVSSSCLMVRSWS